MTPKDWRRRKRRSRKHRERRWKKAWPKKVKRAYVEYMVRDYNRPSPIVDMLEREGGHDDDLTRFAIKLRPDRPVRRYGVGVDTAEAPPAITFRKEFLPVEACRGEYVPSAAQQRFVEWARERERLFMIELDSIFGLPVGDRSCVFCTELVPEGMFHSCPQMIERDSIHLPEASS